VVVLLEQENEIELPVLTFPVMDWELADLRRDVNVLRTKLEIARLELQRAKGTIRKLHMRQRREIRIKKPAEMLNAAYAEELGKGFRSVFVGTGSWKRKKKLVNRLFSSLKQDPEMEEFMVEFLFMTEPCRFRLYVVRPLSYIWFSPKGISW
jgi:hypothetical protein